MSIQIINKDEKSFPFIVCDHCKLEIFKAEDAKAIWLGDPLGRDSGSMFSTFTRNATNPSKRLIAHPQAVNGLGAGLNTIYTCC